MRCGARVCGAVAPIDMKDRFYDSEFIIIGNLYLCHQEFNLCRGK